MMIDFLNTAGNTLLTIFFGIFGLGIIVFVHELGHFIAAKLFKIEVITFSLGWGKKLIGFKYKGTNYQISRIPIGGYCKMKGEYLKDKLDEEADKKLRKEKGSFLSAPPWKRAIVAIAGPFSNLIFAGFIFSILFMIGFNIPSHDSKIILLSDYPEYFQDINYSESPATISGLQTGDRVITIDNQKAESFWHLAEIITNNPDKELIFNIRRPDENNAEFSFVVVPDNIDGEGKIGIYIWIDPIIGEIEAGSHASMAGLKSGDLITAFNGIEVKHALDIEQIIINLQNPSTIELTILRNNEIIEKTLPIETDINGNIILEFSYALKTYHSFDLNILEALQKGSKQTIITINKVILGIIEIFSFKVKNVDEVLASPIRVIQIVGETTTNNFKVGIGEGFNSFFTIISYLSIIIALMNLLPIPALDGGTIVISIFEQIRRKPLKLRNIIRFQVIGFSILGLLFIVALFSDIMYYIKDLFS